MKYQGLKSKSAGDAGLFETFQLLNAGTSLAPSGWQQTSSGLPILMLERITGAMLCGIGVAALWATSLLCGGVLFRGPSYVIELLAGLFT